jgi:protein-S-isoprenylcysteine O-methyltransferase Ste14
MRGLPLRAEERNHRDVPAGAVCRGRPAPRGRGILRGVMRLVSTVFAMAGWRLEHLNAVWVAGSVASVFLAHVLITSANWRLTLPYFFLTLVFYYGGNAVILRSDIPNRAIARLGEERAFRAYETVAGLMFLNQGLGVGCMAALHVPRWEQAMPAPFVLAAGVALFVVGLVVKLSATLTVGVDAYYFRDMFLGRPLAPACYDGPYRFLRNPMYSVGQLQGYGYALLYGSLPGLAAAAAGHLLIYAFYVVAERPFVRSAYIMPRPALTIPSEPR